MNKTWVTGVLAGLLIGMLFTSAGPVEAGSRRLAKLERRVVALEKKVTKLQKVSGPKAMSVVKGRLATLEDVTQLMDAEGNYYGYVNSTQVWSHYCVDGDVATWTDFEGWSEISCKAQPAEMATIEEADAPDGAAVPMEE